MKSKLNKKYIKVTIIVSRDDERNITLKGMERFDEDFKRIWDGDGFGEAMIDWNLHGMNIENPTEDEITGR